MITFITIIPSILITFRFQSQQGHNQTELSFEDLTNQDPLSFIVYLTTGLLLLTSISIWIYSHKDLLNFFLKVNPNPELEINKKIKYRNYQENKNIIIGAGGTLAAVTMIVLLLIPSFIARTYLVESQNGINHGGKRSKTYGQIK